MKLNRYHCRWMIVVFCIDRLFVEEIAIVDDNSSREMLVNFDIFVSTLSAMLSLGFSLSGHLVSLKYFPKITQKRWQPTPSLAIRVLLVDVPVARVYMHCRIEICIRPEEKVRETRDLLLRKNNKTSFMRDQMFVFTKHPSMESFDGYVHIVSFA